MVNSNNPILALQTLSKQKTVEEAQEEAIRENVGVNPLIHASALLDALTEDEEKFLVFKLVGMSDKDAAKAIGVSQGTILNWKKREDKVEFQAAYHMVTENPLEFAANIAAYGNVKAIMKLTEMLDHKNVTVVQFAIDRLISIGGLVKSRFEVTKKEERRVNEGDVDDLIAAYERRKQERTIDIAGDGGGTDSM